VRLSTFAFLLLGIASLGGTGWIIWRATAETREWREMIRFSERGHSKLSGAESSRFDTLARRRAPQESPRRAVLWVSPIDDPPAPRRYVVLFVPGRIEKSGDTLLQLHLFDQSYKPIATTMISTGPGQWETDVRPEPKPELNPGGFQIEIALGAGQRLLQHYQLIQDQFILVRIEDQLGRPVANEYENRDSMLGPPFPNRTPEEWEASLRSPNVAEVLRTLMWLGGRHGPVRRGTLANEDASQFAQTRRRPDLVRRLEELTRSPHPWVAEAARLALPVCKDER